jgi:hypothetical protein
MGVGEDAELLPGAQRNAAVAYAPPAGAFSTLSRLELRVVDALLHERRFLKGEIIFDEGEEGRRSTS